MTDDELKIEMSLASNSFGQDMRNHRIKEGIDPPPYKAVLFKTPLNRKCETKRLSKDGTYTMCGENAVAMVYSDDEPFSEFCCRKCFPEYLCEIINPEPAGPTPGIPESGSSST